VAIVARRLKLSFAMRKLKIDIWSDIACPWCYVGKRRLEAALARFAHRDDVEITWRAFELDPDAPAVRPALPGHAERLAKKYGRTVAEAQRMIAQMTATAKADGLDFRFDRARSGNTFDAHRLIHFAAERGRGDAMKERLLAAYFTEGEAVGDVDTLVRLAAEAGFAADEVRAMLASDAHRDAVRGHERSAAELGIRGVPFFVFDGRYAVSGAQPADALLEVIERAWSERAPETSDGEACGPDGCAVA
jgi:predicted DsbA family dithiol-disulfide isomerase